MDISKISPGPTPSPTPENDWEDIETDPVTPPKAPKGTKRLPRHRLLSYTCCLGKQRRTSNTHFCNPVVSGLSTAEDLETFRNTVSNSKPLCASKAAPLIKLDKYSGENILFPESEVSGLDQSSTSRPPKESPAKKKVSFASQRAVLVYNYKNKKRLFSPQREPACLGAETNHLEDGDIPDCVNNPPILHGEVGGLA